MDRKRRRLGEQLVSAGALAVGQLEQALGYQRIHGGRLGEILCFLRMAPEAEVMATLSAQLGIPWRRVGRYKVPEAVLSLVPRALMLERRALPLAVLPAAPRPSLLVAMAEPQNLPALDELAFASGYAVTPVLASLADVGRAFRLNGLQGGEDTSRALELVEDGADEELVIIRDAHPLG